MEQKGHVASLIALAVVAIAGLAGLVFIAKPAGQREQLQGTAFTVNPSNTSYIDSADLYQNVQAVAERMANGSAYALLQADSTGVMQRVAPTALASSPWTFSSTTKVTSLVETGVVTTYTSTSTVAATDLCDSPVWIINAAAVPTITLPSSSSAFSACLSTNGNTRRIQIVNIGATNAIISAGTGGILKWSLASTTINAGVQATLVVFRTSSVGYNANLNLFPN